MVENVGTVKAYIDDTSVGAPFQQMCDAIEFMMVEGAKIGLQLNMSKGTYLLGKCANSNEATWKKNVLIERFGFHPDVIKIHPDNNTSSLQNYFGAKVLGSYIGENGYVENQMVKKAEKLTACKDSILQVESKQCQWLMLLWCFSQKLIFLQRTLAPRKLDPLVEVFQDCKKDILEAIIEGPLEEKEFEMSLLPINDSGLGLVDSKKVSHAAYVASCLECMTSLPHVEQEMLLHLITSRESESLNDLNDSVQFLATYDENITVHNLLTKLQDGSSSKLQEVLSELWKDQDRTRALAQFEGDSKVHFNRLQDKDAGKFLMVAPKSNLHSMTNNQIKSALQFRLFKSQDCILAAATCNCTRRRPVIDREGRHFDCGCSRGGHRIANHNAIVDIVQIIQNYAGRRTKREQTGVFQGNDEGLGNNARGDLTICMGIRNVVCDVRKTDTCPSNGRQLSIADINNPALSDRHLQSNYDEKMRKYKTAAEAAGYDFLPCVIDAGGKMHPEFKKMLRKALKRASEVRNIPFSKIWNYWISAVMVSLQNGRANSILKHSSRVFGRQLEETFEVSDPIVSMGMHINAA
jgi:hypothetical protein